MICPNCGTNLEDNAAECFLCGCHIQNKQNDFDNTPNYNNNTCPTCGSEISEQDTICPVCGTPIELLTSIENTEEEYKSEDDSDNKKLEPQNKSNKNLIIIAVSVIALVIIGILVFLLLNGNKSDGKSSVTPTETTTNTMTTTSATTESTTETSMKTTTTATTTSTSTATTIATTIPIVENIIDTKYYTLKLPTSWKDKYEYEIHDSDGYGYTLSVYHSNSKQQNYGGWLFSIDLLPTLDDINNYPSVKYLGDLSVYRINNFYVCATFPTDLQFATSTANEYQEMYNEIDNILNSLSQCGESVFTPANGRELPIQQDTFEPYIIQVTNPKLYIYDSPSYSANVVGEITDKGSYTIIEDYIEPGQTSIGYVWGKLKSGLGWINMYDATIVDDSFYIDDSPNVWCPECGYGFYTTGVGTEGLNCPSCGNNWMP